MRSNRIRVIGLTVLLAAVCSSALGAQANPFTPARLLLAAQKPLSLDAAVAKVLRAFGGRVLSADKVIRDRHPYYRIKLLTAKGVVRVVYVDPATGEIL